MQLSDINPLLIPTIPVVLAPIVAWFLGRSGISKQVSTIEYLNKRLDILERLNKLHAELKEAPIRPFLDTEIEHCRAYLRQPVRFIAQEADAEMAVKATGPRVAVGPTVPGATVELTARRETAPQSHWSRFFLTPQSVTVRKRVYKGLFYFFFGVGALTLLGAVSTIIVIFSSPGEAASEHATARLLGMLFVLLFYFGIALLFRRAAR